MRFADSSGHIPTEPVAAQVVTLVGASGAKDRVAVNPAIGSGDAEAAQGICFYPYIISIGFGGNPYTFGGRGNSRGGHQPNSLAEQLAFESAMSNPWLGKMLFISTDPRWLGSEGWAKYTQNINGFEIHYQFNIYLGQIDDFKLI